MCLGPAGAFRTGGCESKLSIAADILVQPLCTDSGREVLLVHDQRVCRLALKYWGRERLQDANGANTAQVRSTFHQTDSNGPDWTAGLRFRMLWIFASIIWAVCL